MRLIETNAIDYLQQLTDAVDVVYLDPMYPHSNKTAKVKKEMASFREIVGQDNDDESLLAHALAKAKYRVAVKRPKHGDCIVGPKPSLQLMGKSSRYDIYTKQGLA